MSQVFSLHGDVSVKTSQADNDLKSLRGEVVRLKNALMGVAGKPHHVSIKADIPNVKTQLAEVTKQIRALHKLGDVKTKITVEAITTEATSRLEALQAQLKGIKADSRIQIKISGGDSATSSTRSAADAQKKLREEAKKAADALRQQKQDGASWARQIDAEIRRNGVTMNRFGDEVRTVTGYLKDLPRDIRVRMHLDGAQSFKKVRSEAQNAARAELGNRVGDGASNAATGAGLAILASLGAAEQKTVEFDRALRNVNSIAQLSEPNLQKLAASIQNISADPSIRQNVTELTTGLYDIYSVGYKGAKALDILRDSAKGAAAGNTETAVAVDALTGVLNANIKGATDSKTVMNALFQTVNDGKVNFPQLAGAIGQTLPFLKSGGVSLQEYGAYMADATAKSQKAEFATNNLNNLIIKLAAPPKQAAKAFEELGIKTGFAELKSVGFTAKMAEIIAKTHGSSDALHKLFPDMQAFTAAQTISTDKMAGYNAMAANQAKANEGIGATARAAGKQNEGAAYQSDLFKKNLENLAVVAGTTLVPMLNEVLKSATGLMKQFQSLAPETQNNYVKFAAVAAILLLFAGRIKSAIELGILFKTALNSAAVANFLFGTSVVASTGKVGAFQVAVALSSRALGVMRLAGITCVGGIGGAFARLGAVGGPLALVAIIIAGFATAFYGARDAGAMSADALIAKWGLLGKLWDTLGNKIANLWTRFNGTDAANEAADQKGYSLYAQIQKKHGKPVKTFQQYVDGTHASGLNRVPKDGYIAELHKDEAVLTSSQANRWRSEQSGSSNGITRNRVLDLASGISIPRDLVGRECAYFVSSLFRKLHIAVDGSNGAANLARNASKVARRIPLSQASAGDLIVWNNPARYGAKQENGKRSGFHVGMALGNGQVETRNRRYRGAIYDRAHAYALDTSSLSPQERAAKKRAIANKAVDVMGLPPATAKPTYVKQGALVPSYQLQRDRKGRFLRAGSAGADSTPETETMRQMRDNAKGVMDAIAELDRSKALRGKENNPLAQLNQKQREGAFQGVSPLNVRDLYDKTRESMANSAKNALEAANAPLSQRLTLLQREAALLASGTQNQTQINDALERETFIREKTDELTKAGVGDPAGEAKKLADLNDQNKTLERRNALTGEYNQLVADTKNAVAANAQKIGIYATTRSGSTEQNRLLARQEESARLSGLVSNGQMDKGTADGELAQWDKRYESELKVSQVQKQGESLLASQNALLSVQQGLESKRLEINGHLSDLARQELDWKYEDVQRALEGNAASADELKVRQQIRDVMQQSADLDYRKQLSDLDTQLQALMQPTASLRHEFERLHELMGSGLSTGQAQDVFNQEEIVAQATQMRDDINAAMSGIRGELDGFWGNLQKDGLSAFGTLFDGILNQLDQFGMKILQNFVWKQLEGLFGGLLNGFMGGSSAGGAGSAGAGSSGGLLGSFLGPVSKGLFGGNNLGGGFGLNGSHANGLGRVPRDGYIAELHKDEAVLTARQATQWRSMDAQTASRSASPSSTRSNDNAATIVEDHSVHYHAPITVKANNPQEFREKTRGSNLPRREQSRRLALATGGGASGL